MQEHSKVDSRVAALLLMQVRMIAIDEARMDESLGCGTPVSKVISCADPVPLSPLSDGSLNDSSLVGARFLSPKPRCRTVSVCSQDINGSPRLSPSSIGEEIDFESGILSAAGSESLFSSDGNPSKSTSNRVCLTQLPFSSSTKFVGDKIQGPIKATLRKKFSWKMYPELEEYLIENRQQYLRYSSQLNYTAEQKRFNNALTQGLLDLAAEEGYVFEDFTFAAIRDRIRCYYKSFVQATKKNRKKKRK